MNAPLRRAWTQAQFLAWAEHQAARHEFDGVGPMAMTGGTINHSLIAQNLHAALRACLTGTGCRVLGPDVGVETRNDAVRYPDAVVTCVAVDGTSRLVPEPLLLFEVVSPSTARTDRIVKVQEYATIASVRAYVLVESAFVGVTILSRSSAAEAWSARTLTGIDDDLVVAHAALKLSDLYDAVAFPADP